MQLEKQIVGYSIISVVVVAAAFFNFLFISTLCAYCSLYFYDCSRRLLSRRPTFLFFVCCRFVAHYTHSRAIKIAICMWVCKILLNWNNRTPTYISSLCKLVLHTLHLKDLSAGLKFVWRWQYTQHRRIYLHQDVWTKKRFLLINYKSSNRLYCEVRMIPIN